jgi:hypothetical protein
MDRRRPRGVHTALTLGKSGSSNDGGEERLRIESQRLGGRSRRRRPFGLQPPSGVYGISRGDEPGSCDRSQFTACQQLSDR